MYELGTLSLTRPLQRSVRWQHVTADSNGGGRKPNATIAHDSHVWHHVILIEVADINIFDDAGCVEYPADLLSGAGSQGFRLGARRRRHPYPKVTW